MLCEEMRSSGPRGNGGRVTEHDRPTDEQDMDRTHNRLNNR
jgi:hypothetical protein